MKAAGFILKNWPKRTALALLIARSFHPLSLVSISKRNVTRMNVQQGKPRRLAKHLGHMRCIGPAIAEQFLKMLDVLVQHMLFEIRHLVRKLGAGEIEDEGAFDNADFQRAQFRIRSDKTWHSMARDLPDSPVANNVVNFHFAFKPVNAIKEFDGCHPI